MEKLMVSGRAARWRGVARIVVDVVLGAAAVAALAFFLWRWTPELFGLAEFWGKEKTLFGQYVNVVKTAAFSGLMLALLGLGSNERLVNLSYTYLTFRNVEVFDEVELRRLDRKARGIRAYMGTLGGSFLALLVVFLLLPWLSSREALPAGWGLEAEPIRFTLMKRIRIAAGSSVVSTPENNLFSVLMEKDTEYLFIVEPVNPSVGAFTLNFTPDEIRQGDLSILSAPAGGRWAWLLMSAPKDRRVRFEVLYSGSSPSNEYRVHVLAGLAERPDKVVSTYRFDNETAVVPFTAEPGQGYAIVAWPRVEGDILAFQVNDADGLNHHYARYRMSTKVAVFRPSVSGDYEIRVFNEGPGALNGFELVIVRLE